MQYYYIMISLFGSQRTFQKLIPFYFTDSTVKIPHQECVYVQKPTREFSPFRESLSAAK